MKLIFMGTPALAVPALEALCTEHEIALVVTQPDKPAGRGKQVSASAVKTFALEHGLPVAQPARARNEEFITQLREIAPEAIAVVAFGQILPRAILDLPPRGCVNAHFSLLPRWRGAAPVQHAILAGDTITGVTTQWMAEKLDSGDIILQSELAIGPEETTGDLWQRLMPLGAEVLRDTMRLIAEGRAPRVPQDENLITWAPTLNREDGHINWEQGAPSIANRVRAMNPWPGAWCDFRGGTLKIWRATIGSRDEYSVVASATPNPAPGAVLTVNSDGVLVATSGGTIQLLEVQAEGRPRLPAAAWARGARLQIGQPLSAG
jgi:methionyl-tRNA formyltransferase